MAGQGEAQSAIARLGAQCGDELDSGRITFLGQNARASEDDPR